MFNKFIIILFSLLLFSCGEKKKTKEAAVVPISRDLKEIEASGELSVLTLYGSTSYFDYRDEWMGYEYELVKKFAQDQDLKLRIIVAKNEADLEQRLLAGEGDLIAYRLQISNERKNRMLFSAHTLITNQVLVQNRSDTMLIDISELVGRKVLVTQGKYYERLNHYNNEIGGGIDIRLAPDSLNVEDLIAMVAEGQIPFTVADNDIALLNKTYYRNIDITLPVSFPQRSAWSVRYSSPELMRAVNQWFEKTTKTRFYRSLHRKYFFRNKFYDTESIENPPLLSSGAISPYDVLIKQQADILGWDWRLLAALIYSESQFNPEAESWAGAIGLMQLMPSTARRMGLADADFFQPEANLKAGIKYLQRLNKMFSSIEDSNERAKFILAAYNSGEAHIFDARALAEKYGKNRDLWTDNVDLYIRLKSNPEYYNDSVCKYGYAPGETIYQYVIKVLGRFEYYKEKVN
jgi:membrane-bound lytic murein transglycosylase F